MALRNARQARLHIRSCRTQFLKSSNFAGNSRSSAVRPVFSWPMAFETGSRNHSSLASLPPARTHVHILGTGNIGRLYAHALAQLHHPPRITLLLHSPQSQSDWLSHGETVSLVRDDVVHSAGRYEIEPIWPPHQPREARPKTTTTSSAAAIVGAGEGEGMSVAAIDNLIVATKSLATLSAVTRVTARLHAGSTVLFSQNGMGAIDEVERALWSDNANNNNNTTDGTTTVKSKSKPRLLAAINSHGVRHLAPFTSVHAGRGSVIIGPVQPQVDISNDSYNNSDAPASKTAPQTKSTQPPLPLLEDLFLASPLLSARLVSPQQLLHTQLEKLAANCAINPVAALARCRNGALLEDPEALVLVRGIVHEVSDVIAAYLKSVASGFGATMTTKTTGTTGLSERRDAATEAEGKMGGRFSRDALESYVLGIAAATAQNENSMLHDVKVGKPTEIDYINGWMARTGAQLGVETPLNAEMVRRIKRVEVEGKRGI